MAVEHVLRKLQRTVRVGGALPEGSGPAHYGVVPDDLATEQIQSISLTEAEDTLRLRAIEELLADLRFEHLDKKAERAVWRLICLSVLNRGHDHVEDFVTEFAHEPRAITSYFPIEYGNVLTAAELANGVLLPLGDERIPASTTLPLDPPTGGVLAVPTIGTNQRLMHDRARSHAQHVLRILRVGARADPSITDRQLRFRLSGAYAFDSGAGGVRWAEGAPLEAPIDEPLMRRVLGQQLAALPEEPRNAAERQAKIALEWLDRALLSTDRVVAILFQFFALEALLGDKSEGEKARKLTFRRTVLGHIVSGEFSPPGLIYFLYDEVRSATVHGGRSPDIARQAQVSFDYGVRQALNEYMAFVRREGITKQTTLLRVLHQHNDVPLILDWLREDSPELWEGFEAT